MLVSVLLGYPAVLPAQNMGNYPAVDGRPVGKTVDATAESMIEDAKFDEVIRLAKQRRNPSFAEAAGWRLKDAGQYAKAAEAFELALSFGADPEVNYGYALCLQLDGQYAKSLEVASRNEDAHPEMKGIVRMSALEASSKLADGDPVALQKARDEFRKLAKQIVTTRDSEMAEAAGWIAFHDSDFQEAITWFGRAEEWGAGSSNRLGLASAFFKSGNVQEAARIAKTNAKTDPAFQELYATILLHRADQVRLSGDELELQLLRDDLKSFGPYITSERNHELALVMGWFHFNDKKMGQAEEWFDRVIEWGGRDEAYYGKAMVREELGDTRTANQLAMQFPHAHEGMKILRDRLAMQEAMMDESGRGLMSYLDVIESSQDADLASMVAWKHFEDEAYVPAREWFARALAWGGNGENHYGMALTALKQQRFQEVEHIAKKQEHADSRMSSLSLMVEVEKLRSGLNSNDSSIYGDLNLDQSPLASRIIESGNADAALVFAWLLYEQEDYRSASEWFGRAAKLGSMEEAYYGQALSMMQYGDLRNAYVIAVGHTDAHEGMPRLLMDLQTKATAELYERGAYESLVERLEDTTTKRPLEPGELRLLGWGYYQSGRIEEAEKVFKDSYHHYRDADSAAGLAEVLASQWKWKELEAISEEVGGPIQNAFVVRLASEHEARGNRRMAAALNPEAFYVSQLENPSISIGASVHSHQSDADIRDLRMTSEPSGMIQVPFGRSSHLEIRAGRHSFSQGKLNPDDLVGSVEFDLEPGEVATDLNNLELRERAIPFRRGAQETVDDVASLEVGWRREGFFAPFASIGGLDARTETIITANIGATVHGAESRATLELFRDPIYESVLSSVGLTDPYTGRTWGGVTESGVRGEFGTSLTDTWFLNTQFSYGVLDGEGVEQNDHLLGGIGLSKSIKETGENLEYLRVGPWMQLSGYDQNLSFYTPGHGGYFSPQDFFLGAGSVDAMTVEGEKWLARGRLSLGYYNQDSDAAPLFPGEGGDQPFYEGSSEGGLFFQAEAEGAVALSKFWLLGMSLGYAQAADYDGWDAGVWMRYVPGEGIQKGLVQEDLDR